MNSRLVDLSGALLFNRVFASSSALLFLGLHPVALLDDRARAVEAAAAQARQAPGARDASRAPPRQLGGERVVARDATRRA